MYNQVYSRSRVQLISPVNTVIIVINVVVFAVLSFMGDTENADFMCEHGACYWPYVIYDHAYYSLLTSAFVHFGISHLINNMIVLAYIGDNLERTLGKIKYLILYLICAIGSGAVSCGWYYLQDSNSVSGGASGAIFGVVGALLVIVIRNKGRLEDISTRQIGLFIAFTIFHGINNAGTDNAAHIGGLLTGVLLGLLLYRKKKQTWEYT